ncbi:conserved hypothetical protein [Beggiatoa sp. PS]|nr:conserved hypothetical protein [Beggiatoa sp. PS]
MQVTLEIPERYFLHQDVNQIAQKLKLYSALFMFQSQQLSLGAACELTGMDYSSFMEACKQHEIPVMNYDVEELEADLLKLNLR